jgi:hypothetical protein
MRDRFITQRERWLDDAIAATRDHVTAEEAEIAYDLRAGAPGSHDYDAALDGQACLERTRATLAALEAEVGELRRRSVLRHHPKGRR